MRTGNLKDPGVAGAQADPATPDASTDVTQAIRVLLATPRVLNMCPPGHPRAETQFGELGRLMQAVGGLVLTVDRMRILVDGEPWDSAPEVATGLAIKLRRRRIRHLHIDADITRGELGTLVDLLSIDHLEVLRHGGVRALLGEEEFPHLRFEMADEQSQDEALDLPVSVADALEDCFCEPATMERLIRLRRTISDRAARDGVGTLDEMIANFFRHPEWEQQAGTQIRIAFNRFLDGVEQAMFSAGTSEESQFAASRACDEDAPRVVDEAPSEAGAPAADAAALADVLGPDLAELKQSHEQHDPDENALLIQLELLLGARHRVEYDQRRESFLHSMADPRYATAALARVLRYVVFDLPETQYEERESLVAAVVDHTQNEEAFILFLVALTRQREAVHTILGLLAARTDPFALLARLVRAPALAVFRHELKGKLLDAARLKPDALTRWARMDRDGFFMPEIFEPLFARGVEGLGGICKEILAEGPDRDRGRLIQRLRRENTLGALRLLVLGLQEAGTACDSHLIDALADFPHPLAVGALREVVHRNNTGTRIRREEVATAFKGLLRVGSEGAAFLWEIVERRAWWLPVYRRELRTMALDFLGAASA